MNVSDYIFDFLIKKGVTDAFVVTGGQAMFLNDAMARRKEIKPIFTHHEQTCGMSADAYGRITNKLGVAVVTAGPGSMNVVNGLVGGWCDSAPMMIISGQSALNCVKYQEESGIRQYGIQGIFVKPFVEKGTKYFVTVDDPAKIEYYMQKAYHKATTGRPGPVWIDVPLDVQRMQVPDHLISSYHPEEKSLLISERKKKVQEVVKLLEKSRRPLVVAGQGIRLAKAENQLKAFIEKYNLPLITTRLGIDIIASDHPLYIGRPGNYGERSANLATQTADLILSIGSRLSTASIGHNSKEFGCRAKKIVVDIDEKELNKPIFAIDLKVCDDASLFLEELNKQEIKMQDSSKWLKNCQTWKEKYPVVTKDYQELEEINSYYFVDELSKQCDKDTMVVVDTGSCFHVACQSWKVKEGQRFLTTGGLSSMGWWVAGIGACVASNRCNTVVITGDGSLQMNIQEFATIKHNRLPIKTFVLNNDGYLLIRQTQRNFMEGRLFGEGPETGVWCPENEKIAAAYGIKFVSITEKDSVQEKIKEVLSYDGPVICDVKIPKWQLIIPRVSSEKKEDGTLVSRNFEDMFPYLDPKELADIIEDTVK
ncbi:MAG: thiamine pyrophosphate-binding protein [Elusimicrobiaceae bacterium]|nr:thiamine pyrophosphate-binding protein [Elusimicrobiaceae bacterium]